MSTAATKRASDVSARRPRGSGPYVTVEATLPAYVARAVDEAATALRMSRGRVLELAFCHWQDARGESLDEQNRHITAGPKVHLGGGVQPKPGWGDAPIDERYASHLEESGLNLK